jgi:hypothetical protein
MLRYAFWLPRTKRFPSSLPSRAWAGMRGSGPRRLARYACSASQGLNGCSFSTGLWKTGWIILRLVHGSRKLQALFRRREEIE